MTQTHKQLEKSIKSPDRFQKTAVDILSWLANNPGYVWAVVGPILALMLAWSGWSYWARLATAERLEELGKVEAVFQDELKLVADQSEAVRKQVDDLALQIGNEKDAKKKDELTLRKAVLDKQIDAFKPDHTGSLKGYQEFFTKHGTKPEGWAAGLRAASIQLQKKDFAAAKAILTQLVEQSKAERFYQIQGKYLLVGVNEELGDVQAALTESTRLEAVVDDKLKPQVLLTKARLQINQQQNDDARKTLDELLEKFGTSAEADKARTIKALYLGG